MRAAAALLLAGAALVAGPVAARPFVPADDAVVVERLPYRPSAAERERRKALARRPSDLALALRLARDALQRARRLGDPRELGQAQAALAPWWAAADAPPPVRLLRATIRQSEHDFSAALDDLGTLIDGDGDGDGADAALRQQALLTRAGVQQVLGRLDAAERDCRTLAAGGGGGALYGEACLAELSSLTGGAAGRVAAATRLDALDRAAPGQRWLVLMRAELAERMGDARAAEALYRQVAGGDDADVYTVAAYADWLLAHGRGADAARLLQRHPVDADALALRRVLAARACAAPDAAAQAQRMRARFDAARLRGPSLHLREEALLALDAFGDATSAWRLAQEQWLRQKEPADALLYVRAAIAAGERARAQALAAQLRARGWHDERITRALAGSPT